MTWPFAVSGENQRRTSPSSTCRTEPGTNFATCPGTFVFSYTGSPVFSGSVPWIRQVLNMKLSLTLIYVVNAGSEILGGKFVAVLEREDRRKQITLGHRRRWELDLGMQDHRRKKIIWIAEVLGTMNVLFRCITFSSIIRLEYWGTHLRHDWKADYLCDNMLMERKDDRLRPSLICTLLNVSMEDLYLAWFPQ